MYRKLILGNRNAVSSIQGNYFHLSRCLYDDIMVKVPSMGDSITEGTVIEWTKSIGEQVNVDDVVAVIETDKVSVDIRAPSAGVLVKTLAEVDQTVEVGQELLVLDSSAAADTALPTPTAPASPPTASETPTLSIATAPAGGGQHPPARIPLIKFLGKRALLPPHTGGLRLFNALLGGGSVPTSAPTVPPTPPAPAPIAPAAVASSAPAPAPAGKAGSSAIVVVVDNFSELAGGAMHGRPSFSAEEMEAIDLGGDLPAGW